MQGDIFVSNIFVIGIIDKELASIIQKEFLKTLRKQTINTKLAKDLKALFTEEDIGMVNNQ